MQRKPLFKCLEKTRCTGADCPHPSSASNDAYRRRGIKVGSWMELWIFGSVQIRSTTARNEAKKGTCEHIPPPSLRRATLNPSLLLLHSPFCVFVLMIHWTQADICSITKLAKQAGRQACISFEWSCTSAHLERLSAHLIQLTCLELVITENDFKFSAIYLYPSHTFWHLKAFHARGELMWPRATGQVMMQLLWTLACWTKRLQ